MLRFLHDKLTTARLRARYQRRVHERLLELTEAAGSQPVADEAGWTLLGGARGLDETARVDARTQARELTRTNPYACNMLRLLEAYVAGPGLNLMHLPRDMQPAGDASAALRRRADRLWADFLTHNQGHYSYQEHARRAWRDGECFVRKFPLSGAAAQWPPDLRFASGTRPVSGGPGSIWLVRNEKRQAGPWTSRP